MQNQPLVIYYREKNKKHTECKRLVFDIDPAKTPVIVRECFLLANKCIEIQADFAIEVNGVTVVKSDPNGLLDTKKALILQ